ncbi:hypothetical protein THTE_0355 [Thermogutta terrifontis]|uniref:Uncharacterized protein n=1 Tax=Thermogutta terrifontis TaxID=1331910 RepID=A0A286RAI2_9BACT|nr:hypothetical protein THTE_0355 [Thermogutta terrifontis]
MNQGSSVFARGLGRAYHVRKAGAFVVVGQDRLVRTFGEVLR